MPENIAALQHIKVIEVGGPAAALCSFWLAGLGADVIKVEPPSGDRLRTYPPFANDTEDVERGIYHLHFDAGKRSIALDLENAGDRTQFLELVRSADVLIESFQRGYLESIGLGYKELHELHPGLILLSATVFGQSGPHKDFQGDDLIAMASSGYMSWAGDNEMAPCVAPSFQGYQLGGLIGSFAILAALRYKRSRGIGQWIDLSLQQALIFLYGGSVLQYLGSRDVVRRVGSQPFGGASIYAVQDGHIIIAPFSKRAWQAMEIGWMEDPLLSEEPYKSDQEYRRAHADVIAALYEGFISDFKMWDFVNEAQERHIPVAPVSTPSIFLESEQTKARELIVQREHPVVGTYKTLSAPFTLSQTPWNLSRPAPQLDEHRVEILSDVQPQALRTSSVNNESSDDLPLNGVRILDFTRVRSGPTGTSILGDYGAQVIKIESNLIDTFRQLELRVPQFDGINRDKESIELNLKDPRARDLFLELVKHADVIIENFTYQVMDNLGLSYDEIRSVKEDIIVVGMPPMGKTGPYNWWTTYGQQLMGYSGGIYLWGYEESPMEAHPKIPYPDDVAAAQMDMAILAALEHRDRSGKGQYIEVAQVEGLAYVFAPLYMDTLINGRELKPLGNSHPVAAPFGVYRTQGYDAWVAISCETDDHWRALLGTLDDSDWAQDSRFGTRPLRQENAVEIDAQITEWTSQRTPRQAMTLLQKAGVPAFEVSNNEDIYHDLHLRERGFLRREVIGSHGEVEFRGPLVEMSESPGKVRMSGPDQGAQNKKIFGGLLGMSDDEIERLKREKIIY
jgi:crotonobetainyl-CoA:carnitine CoA-transferase CaiB-like acyl-CoA transferase